MAAARLTGRFRVHNLEVEHEHCYYAGAAAVQSHNACRLFIGALGKGVRFILPKAAKNLARRMFSWAGRTLSRGFRRGGGLTTPGKFFRGKTKDEAAEALTRKYGPPTHVPEPGKVVWYNPRTGRSIVIHDQPAHGGPHIDITRKGKRYKHNDREIPLLPDAGPWYMWWWLWW